MFLEQKRFYYLYDPTATYVYGRMGSPSGYTISGRNGVETSGASTTVTATDGTPFDPVKVGDIITFFSGDPPEDTKAIRTVATKTSGSEITVDSNVTLSGGTPFIFDPFTSGTAATDGWHSVNHWSAITIHYRLETLASTSIDILPEGSGGDLSGPVALAAATNLTAAGSGTINLDQVLPFLRVGVKSNTDSAGDELTIWAVGELLQAK